MCKNILFLAHPIYFFCLKLQFKLFEMLHILQPQDDLKYFRVVIKENVQISYQRNLRTCEHLIFGELEVTHFLDTVSRV